MVVAPMEVQYEASAAASLSESCCRDALKGLHVTHARITKEMNHSILRLVERRERRTVCDRPPYVLRLVFIFDDSFSREQTQVRGRTLSVERDVEVGVSCRRCAHLRCGAAR